MYARGILFGKMKYELGDHSFVRCPENNLLADIEFKTKGYFGGTYNAIGGVIKNEKSGEILYELSGMWSGEMVAKDVMVQKIRLPKASQHLISSSPERKWSFSTRQMQGIRRPLSDHLTNKMSENRKDYGRRQ